MKTIRISSIIWILVLIVIACDNNNDERGNSNSAIIGTWISEDGESTSIRIESGFMYSYEEEEYDFTYTLKGNKLTIIISKELSVEFYYKIKIEGDIMKATEIEEGGITIFHKKHSNKEDENKSTIATKIIGSWYSADEILTFNSRGKGLSQELNGDEEISFTYTLTGNKITIKFSDGNKVTGSVIIYGDEMYITINDDAIKYTKE